jgi:peptidoglycan/xylan/chitin deacetylase (PgdA/CDA1 family)
VGGSARNPDARVAGRLSSARVKRWVRDVLCGVLHVLGLTGLLVRCRRGAIVLCYHRVNGREDALRPALRPERFADHLGWVGKRFRLVPALRIAEDPGAGERRAAITFDDGYPDTLAEALPRLQAAGAPATLFAITGSRVPWWERVHRIPGIDHEAVKHRLKSLDPGTRDREIEALVTDHGEELEGEDLLGPAELGPWRDAGMDVGAHTRTHPILPLCPEAEVREEVVGSRTDLAEILGEPPAIFAYPGGAWDEAVAAVVREAGFAAAFATGGGRVTAASPRFALPRIDVRPDSPVAVLAAEVAGILPALRRILRRS